ncbi:MAG: peptidylprolyl isomerase [Phycisphaerae bacterium]
MKRLRMVLACGLALLASSVALAGGPQGGNDEGKRDDALYPRVQVDTTVGSFVLELNGEKAPVSTMNFIWYAEDGYYNGTIFHRVIPDQYIQGGGYLPNLDRKVEGLRPGIPSEWDNGLRNEQWTIAMSRRAGKPESATSTFQINMDDNPAFDMPQADGAAYTVFGKVVDGLEAIAKIRDSKTTTNSKYGGTAATIPAEPIVIKSVKVIRSFDRGRIERTAKRALDALRNEREYIKERNALELAEAVKEIEEETGRKMVTTDSGLMYVDLKVGDGPSPKLTDTVTAHYTGWLLDGEQFQTSRHRDAPPQFRLVDTLPAWIEGLKTMKVGGKRKLIAPPELGYGPMGRPGIVPPNTALIFEIELLGIVQSSDDS